jgi:hypothetical protein
MPEQPQPISSSIRQPESLLDDVLGPGPVLVVVPRDFADVLLGEAVRELAQVLLLIGEGEVDH